VGISAALACITAIAIASVPFAFRHPQAPDKQFVIRNGRIVAVSGENGQPGDVPAEGAPRAVTDSSTHDFGVMDPLTMGQHTFVIRNEGDAPLRLIQGPTTCKCTLSDLSDSEIPPGGEAQVRLEWNSGSKYEIYHHEATVYTNDPRNQSLVFAIEGEVRTLLGSDQPDIAFSGVEPDQRKTQELLIYSQIWDSFSLSSIQSPLEGLTWSVEPAAADRLAPWKARSGYVMHVTTPADLPQGYFSTVLNVRVDDVPVPPPPSASPTSEDLPTSEAPPAGDAAADSRMLAIPVNGKVLRRLSVYGNGINAMGIVNAGVLDAGQGARLKLMMKVRDTDPELALERIEVVPDFVQVSVEPHETLARGQSTGLYYLNVEIPRGAPECSYLGAYQGHIKLLTTHPRLPETELKLEFAVVPRR
jgi:hypothetical protein